jgi:hypothetical protein
VSKDQANQDARKKREKNIEQCIFAPKIKSPAQAKAVSRITLALEILAGSFFYVFGDDLTSWGYVTWGWIFHYLVLCSAALLLADLIFKFWPKQRVLILSSFAASCVIMFLLYCWLASGPEKAKPHLTLCLKTSTSPNATLMFTNSFLFIERYQPPKKIRFPARLSFLVVPVPVGYTNVVLRFSLLNDSAPQYAVADDAALTLDIPQLDLFIHKSEPSGKLKWSADAIWNQSEDSDGTHLHFQIPKSLLPGVGAPAPGITFDMSDDASEKAAILAIIRSKYVPQIPHMFNLVFIRSNGVVDPYFETNDIAVVKLLVWPLK